MIEETLLFLSAQAKQFSVDLCGVYSVLSRKNKWLQLTGGLRLQLMESKANDETTPVLTKISAGKNIFYFHGPFIEPLSYSSICIVLMLVFPVCVKQ